MDHAHVLAELEAVRDPCSVMNRLNLNIVEMGLVREIRVDGDEVQVDLLLTDPTCVYFFEIARQIKDRLARLPGVRNVEVRSTTDVLWMPDRMNEETRTRIRRRREERARELGVSPRGAALGAPSPAS
jgi:metal-sulfur cluster biosynthetic enzyme